MAPDLLEPPVIIGGCGRSGTSLLLAVLSAHPALAAIPQETEAFCPTAWEAEPDLTAPFRPEIIEHALSDLEIPPSARRWAEKSPKNILFLGRLIDLFGPEVRLINLVRDGRDVVTSFHPTRRRERPWVSPERWVNDVSAGEPFDSHPSVLVVRYEDLILDFEPTVGRICAFLGEEVHPNLLSWHDHATVRRHVAWADRVARLHPESIGKWRLPENKRWVEPLLALDQARRLLTHYGYVD